MSQHFTAHQSRQESDPLEADTLIRTLLGLLVRPEISTLERRALSEAIATLRINKAVGATPLPPFIKHG